MKILKLLMAFILCITLVGCQTTTNQNSGENTNISQNSNIDDNRDKGITLDNLPEYPGEPFVALYNNVPDFDNEIDKAKKSFETYSDLDSLGRCGVAYANIGKDLMPTDKRGDISSVKPTGWINKKYDTSLVDGGYIYNRCHLIGHQLAGEDANEKNLITGTRYFNVEGMLPFENMVADYVKETNNHVLYRVTPIYTDENLLADGVLMEAESVEDKGKGISYCVYVYNVQPGIKINYETGDSSAKNASNEMSSGSSSKSSGNTYHSSRKHTSTQNRTGQSSAKGTYIINENTNKFHKPDCRSVKMMKDKNKKAYTGKRSELINSGYEPCKNCNP